MYGRIDGWLNGWMHACLHVCMYVYSLTYSILCTCTKGTRILENHGLMGYSFVQRTRIYFYYLNLVYQSSKR